MQKLAVLLLALVAESMAMLGNKNSCYPAKVKAIKHFNCIPNPPVTMCARCPLDTTNLVESKGGGFKKCNDMYKLEAGGCKGAIKQYVKNTRCDKETGKAWTNYYMVNKGNTTAMYVLDRLLYTVCKCWAVTMGWGSGCTVLAREGKSKQIPVEHLATT